MVPNDSDGERDIVEAVQAVRGGAAQAYATIVRRFQASMMTLCTAILRDRQAAEELAQDVFVRAYQRLDSFDVRQPMKPWLVRIAYRLAQQRRRTRARDTARRRAAATMCPQDRNGAGPAEELLVDERSNVLWQVVSDLPMAQRTAVVLYYREDLTVEQVARAMGVSPGTVKTHLFRARARIQVDLRAKGFGEGDMS
jgi:RNA polymerase sigma-70 factor (ECF subfamily)